MDFAHVTQSCRSDSMTPRVRPLFDQWPTAGGHMITWDATSSKIIYTGDSGKFISTENDANGTPELSNKTFVPGRKSIVAPNN